MATDGTAQPPDEGPPEGLAEHNVMAEFAGLDEARTVIDALERAGFEAANVFLFGPSADRASGQTDTRLAGLAAGGMLGGISGVGMTQAYELAYQTVRAGRAMVGVHSDDLAEVERAEDILVGEEPLSVHRFDRRGRRIPES